MRRSEREVTGTNEIFDIISRCGVCRIALCDGGNPYIVPMNFGAEKINERVNVYFHCAHKGKKLDIISKNPSCCFECDTSHTLKEGERACEYSYGFESVVAFGEISIVSNSVEKEHGLTLLMKNYSPQRDFSFSQKDLDAVTVLKFEASVINGKRKIYEL